MYSKNSYSLSTFWKYNSQRWEQSILCPQGILAIRNEVIWPCLDWFSCCLLLICKIVYLFLSFWQDLKEAENDWATVFIYGRLEFMGHCWLNGSAQRPKKKICRLKEWKKMESVFSYRVSWRHTKQWKYTSLLRGKYLIGTIQNIIHNLGT